MSSILKKKLSFQYFCNVFYFTKKKLEGGDHDNDFENILAKVRKISIK